MPGVAAFSVTAVIEQNKGEEVAVKLTESDIFCENKASGEDYGRFEGDNSMSHQTYMSQLYTANLYTSPSLHSPKFTRPPHLSR